MILYAHLKSFLQSIMSDEWRGSVALAASWQTGVRKN